MLDTIKATKILGALGNNLRLNVMLDLRKGEKNWSYFVAKYGKRTRFGLNALLDVNMVEKTMLEGFAVGYRITDFGKTMMLGVARLSKEWQKENEENP